MIVLDKLSDILMFVAKLFVVVMAVHIVVDVAIRTFTSISFEGTIEIASNYYMVAVITLPVAMIQRKRGHLIAEVFTQNLSDRRKRHMDAFGNILMVVFLFFIVWQSTLDAIESTENQEYEELTYVFLYIWPTKWFVPLGFGLMAAFALLQAVRSLAGAEDGDQTPDDRPDHHLADHGADRPG